MTIMDAEAMMMMLQSLKSNPVVWRYFWRNGTSMNTNVKIAESAIAPIKYMFEKNPNLKIEWRSLRELNAWNICKTMSDAKAVVDPFK